METETKLTIKDYVYKVSLGISNAVLVALGIGLLFDTIGDFTGIVAFNNIGTIAQLLLAPAFGAGIAFQLGTNTLVVFSSMIAATVGSNAVLFSQASTDAVAVTGQVATQAAGFGIFTTGQPISAVLAGLIAALVGKWLTGKTPLDMVLVPFGSLFVGGLAGVGLAYVTTPLMLALSQFMANSITISPIIGSIVISVAWSALLMTPASSAALAIALQLDPTSSAAALIGCTAQFVGFTVMSFRENKVGANIAQGLITPKVQFANLTKNPQLVIPPFISAAICAPIATVVLNLRVGYQLAGLGLNSLIAPLNLLANDTTGFIVYIAVGVFLSGAITYVVYRLMKAAGKVQTGALTIEMQ
ncbi:PTS transporter subunit IIC [Enterococcus sp. LJL120]